MVAKKTKEQDMQDRFRRQDMQDNNRYHHLTEIILGCSFDVMNELGSGFLESVYKNALFLALKEKQLNIEIEKRYEVIFRGTKIGLYIADLVVEGTVVVELKCCEQLLPEHQAQVINYLKVSDALIGLLINFGKRIVEYKRLHHPNYPSYPPAEGDHAYPVLF